MLTEAQVELARETAEKALPDAATIYRRQLVSDGGGEFTEEWTVLAEPSCRIAPVGGGESQGEDAGARIAEETTHVVTFAAKQDVAEADVIEVEGQAYNITRVAKRGGWEITRRVQVKESIDGVPVAEEGSGSGS